MRPDRWGDARFPTTHWSLVARAGVPDLDAKREALGQLLARYLPALVAHLTLGKGLPPEDAEDVVQDFVTRKIIERDLVERADAQSGKFRTFLLTAIDRFLIDRRRHERARKRSPQGAIVEIDDPGELAGQGASPSDAFDAAWAREVLAEVIRRMRAECEWSRPELWGVFECRLLNPMLEGAEPVEYEALAERFRLQSPTQAANLLVTAKRMFVRAMRAVVAEYVLGDAEIDVEINELRQVLARNRS